MKRLVLILALSCTPAVADPLSGYSRATLTPAHRDAPTQAAYWYPARFDGPGQVIGKDAVFAGTSVQTGAQIAPGRYPVILMSHGSGGNIDNMGWLAAPLAAQGAIVIGVNHPGSTSRDSIPARSVRIWDRTQDVSAALDWALADPILGPMIDPENVSVLGFSMGGATALQLAGARMDRAAFRDYCARAGDIAVDCTFLTNGGVDLTTLPTAWEGDLRDPRITKVVAIDSGYSHAMRADSLAAIAVPVLILSQDAPDNPWRPIGTGPSGSDLAAHIPGAQGVTISPALHYSFLGECTYFAPLFLWASGEDPICHDPAGSDRAVIHAAIIHDVAAFLFPGQGP
jgi:predicted dienelactone hydrolase